MRVSGGEARGRTLSVAPGTRPTTDRVRQAIFNALAALAPIEGKGLDLYAGSGALGIEALSRGLEHCDFVEVRNVACKAIRANLDHAGFGRRSSVICSTAATALETLRGPYAVVFADPPYADEAALAPIEALAGRLVDSPVIVLEHSGRREPPARLAGMEPLRSKRYGDSAVTFYGKEV